MRDFVRLTMQYVGYTMFIVGNYNTTFNNRSLHKIRSDLTFYFTNQLLPTNYDNF